MGIAVDAAGSAYVTGITSSSTPTPFPTVNPIQPTYGGGPFDAFVTKVNAAGSALVYSTYLGGNGNDRGRAIAVDAAGNAYVTGGTTSVNFPTVGAGQPSLGGGQDAFVTKVNATGSALAYSTYLGGSGNDQGFGIAVDPIGRAWVTGFTNSTNFPTVNPIQPTLRGVFNAFVANFNIIGSMLQFSTYYGGSGYDEGFGIAVDSVGNVAITGSTTSTDFPTLNALQPNIGGLTDAAVVKGVAYSPQPPRFHTLPI